MRGLPGWTPAQGVGNAGFLPLRPRFWGVGETVSRIALGSRGRIARGMPQIGTAELVQAALILLILVQAVRLAWTLFAPVEPTVEAEASDAPKPVPTAILGAFDPFFRLGGDIGPEAVTSLDLSLHGVRQDQASGRGSAIIQLPDGQQRSFAVGDEVVPGVKLQSVEMDGVTLLRNGAPEKLFMDQGEETPQAADVPVAPKQAPLVAAPPVAAAPAAPPRNFGGQMRFVPRLNGTTLTGIAVQPQGDANVLKAAGLMPGDVIVAVNGKRVASAGQLQGLSTGTTLQIERGGRVMRVKVGGGQ